MTAPLVVAGQLFALAADVFLLRFLAESIGYAWSLRDAAGIDLTRLYVVLVVLSATAGLAGWLGFRVLVAYFAEPKEVQS